MSKEVKKITEEELKNIKEVSSKYNGILTEMGFHQLRQCSLSKLAEEEIEKLDKVKKDLEEKYGPVNINLEDGTYSKIESQEDKGE
tara:strand:+ start:1472 stop:1729 length:258 start_codon:yes stop_codon:yes gene_type:complete